MSLGGMHDEAELRGHRRTYIGAMPGRLLQAIRRAGVNNPVLMLDEIDKLGRDYRGDPGQRHAGDPRSGAEQSRSAITISICRSICRRCSSSRRRTRSTRSRGRCLDRMEILRLSGYSEEEKVEIAKRYLLPRQLKETGLTRGAIADPARGVAACHQPLHARGRRARTGAHAGQHRPQGGAALRRGQHRAGDGRRRRPGRPARSRARAAGAFPQGPAGRRVDRPGLDRGGRRRAVRRGDAAAATAAACV